MSNVPILLAGAGVAYYFYNQNKETSVINSETISSEETTSSESLCPEGYTLSEDGTECIPNEVTGVSDGGCGEGYILSTDGKECLPTGNPCGDDCFKFENNECNRIPNCKSVTGSDLGDQFLYFGESITAGIIFDMFGRKVISVADRVAEKAIAKEASEKLAKEIAEQNAKKVAEAVAKKSAQEAEEALAQKTAREVARKAIQNVAQREATEMLGKRATTIISKKLGIEALTIAGKKLATKMAIMVAKINAQNATGIGIILSAFTAIAISLQVGLAVAGVTFDKENEQDWDWDTLPEGARIAIEALPLFGDVISIMSPFIAFKTGCQSGLVEQNGLCYDPPKEGFECEGFLCYAKSSAYPFDPLSETFAHMAKRILTDTGIVPEFPPPGMVKDGALAYQKPDWASSILAGVAWGSCPPGTRDDGALCYNPIQCDGCNSDEVDDGLFCRVPLRGGDTHTECSPIYWDGSCNWGIGCLRGGDCRTWTNPVTGGQSRPKTCRGGNSDAKRSQVLQPYSLECGSDRVNINGLCYKKDIPPGYSRKTLGLLDQNAPLDKPEWFSYENFNPSQDIGVSVQKATYTRPPYQKFAVYGKKKRDPPPQEPDPPLPPLCSTINRPDGFILNEQNGTLCRETATPDGFDITADGLHFFKKCREGFSFNFTNNKCDRILDNGDIDEYDNSEGVFEVQYDFR
jgi:hypothetical protein